MVNSFWEALLDGLFPARCLLCQLPSHAPLPLCRDCRAELAANTVACPRCALPLPAGSEPPRLCGQCLLHPPPFHAAHAPWLYADGLAYIIQRWKFQGQRNLTRLLADLWLARPANHSRVDLIVPVPLHWRRLCRRGYNQADLLAQELHRAHPDLPVERRLLRRSQATAPQSGTGAAGRRRNLRGAFTVRGPCDNLRIALVDDVMTTGATAAAAATALVDAGAEQVELWCLARTPAPGTGA